MRIRVVALIAVLAAATSGCAAIRQASLTPAGAAPAGASVEPSLSADGTVLAFASTATDLVANDTNGVSDVFVRDATGTISRISEASDGTEANGPSSHPSVSADGRYVAFQSDASDLVPDDTNGTTDVFRHDRVTGTTTLVSIAAPGAPAAIAASPTPPDATAPTATSGSPAALPPLRDRAEVAPVRVIVRLRTAFTPEGRLRGAARSAQRRAITAGQDHLAATIGTGGRELHRLTTLPLVVAEVDRAALDRLRADPAVAAVTPDDPVPATLANSGPVVGLPSSQDAGYTGRGVAVAILDTGVDSGHPFLGGRVVEEACYSAVGSCPNGEATQTGPGSGVPCTYAPSGCRHGTHVAGIAAGDALDATGVAPRASIIAIQVFSRIDSPSLCTRGENPCPLSFPSDWILALEHLYELRDTYRIASANMSIGGLTSTTACDTDAVKPAIDQLRSVGVATVIAAGNEGRSDAVGYPGCISSAVTVGASDNADRPASFTNSNPVVDLFAPGVGVRSSVPGGGFAFFSGTSMATPHVTGAFALAKEQHPDASVDDILTRMQQTGAPFHDSRNGLDFARLCTSGTLGLDRCPTDRGSRRPSISGDGTKIAFESVRPLVAADTNGVSDIYLREVTGATTERISMASPSGAQASGPSTHASITTAGTRVAFDSTAPDLVSADTNGRSDVFVRDVPAATTTRVSIKDPGIEATGTARDASIGDSRVAFVTDAALVPQDTNGTADVYSATLGGFAITLDSVATGGSVANGPSRAPTLSADGRFVVFTSDADNLDAGDTDTSTDAFVHDRASGLTQRVSTRFWLGGLNAATTAVTLSAGDGILALSTAASDAVGAADGNRAFDVFQRALATPVLTGSTIAAVQPGQSVPFTLTGRGLHAPMTVTTPAGSASVGSVTATAVSGTISVAPDTAPGDYDLVVVDVGADPMLFGATVCGGCLHVTP